MAIILQLTLHLTVQNEAKNYFIAFNNRSIILWQFSMMNSLYNFKELIQILSVKTTIIWLLQPVHKNTRLSSKHVSKPSLEKLNILPTISIGYNPKTI